MTKLKKDIYIIVRNTLRLFKKEIAPALPATQQETLPMIYSDFRDLLYRALLAGYEQNDLKTIAVLQDFLLLKRELSKQIIPALGHNLEKIDTLCEIYILFFGDIEECYKLGKRRKRKQ